MVIKDDYKHFSTSTQCASSGAAVASENNCNQIAEWKFILKFNELKFSSASRFTIPLA